jgi:hypothetical protein
MEDVMPSAVLLWSIRALMLLGLGAMLVSIFGSALRIVWSFL